LSADADKVVRHLSRTGVTPAAELKALLGKSQPTLSRVLHELGDRVVALGAARARRYALPQPLFSGAARLQLHWVDETGQRQPWGELTLLAGDQVHVRGPELDLLVHGGLPWFLAPLQREGTYLGRLLDGLPSGQPWSLAAQLQAASRLGDAAGALVLQADLPASAEAGQEAPFPTLDLSPPLLTSVVAAPSALVDLADRVELNEQLAGANSGQVALLSPSPSLPPTLPHTLPGGIPALASRIAAHPDQLPLPLRRRQASPASRLALYDRLAERLGQDLAQAAQESAAQGSTPGSAALPRGAWLGGSQPKLLCRLSDGGAEVVKFSPRLGNPLARRLSDLLHAEATALAVLAHAGVATAEAEILVSEERVYLVTQRIDRVPAPRLSLGPTGIPTSTAAAGTGGRRHIVSLAQAHQALVSAAPPRHWSATAQALALQKRLPSADAERIAFLQAYAQLIGSHPQRLHKLPLQVTDLARGRFVLAPLYSLPAQRWRPDPLVQDDTALSPFAPDPAALASSARPWAALYWQTVAGSAEFSLAWRRLAQEMATRLER
jgi:hypothetical protein